MIRRKWRLIVLAALGLAWVASVACVAANSTVSFESLYSYMEVSPERDSLVFRALMMSNSWGVVTRYSLKQGGGADKHSYYLTLYMEMGNKKPGSGIEYMLSGAGIKVTSPRGSFDPETDRVYYRDKTGIHPIRVGSKQSWKDYLEARWQKPVSDSDI